MGIDSLEPIKELTNKILRYSTPFGHIWVATTFLCRLIPLATVGEDAYADEQDKFECVTTQPGCQLMCYNLFAPMSHIRFWGMQILIISFPTLIFSMIAANYNAKYKMLKEKVDNANNAIETGSATKGSVMGDYINSVQYMRDASAFKKFKSKKRKNEEEVEEIIWAPGMRMWYIIHLFFKLILEILGLYLLYVLQTYMHNGNVNSFMEMWHVPMKYKCTQGGEINNWACSQDSDIPCWVSRPYEKQVFLTYMGIMSFVSSIIVVCDFFYVIQKVSVKRMRRRKQRKQLQRKDDGMDAFLAPIPEKDVSHL